MTKSNVTDFLKRHPRGGSSEPAETSRAPATVDNPASEESAEPAQEEAPSTSTEGGLIYRLQTYLHERVGFVPAPAGYVADEEGELETAVQTEGSTPGEAGGAGRGDENGEATTTTGEEVAADEQQTDVEEPSPAAKKRIPALETIIGAGLAPSIAITLAANADHDRYLCERFGEALGLPGELIYVGKLATGAVYGAVGGALYLGLDGLYNKEFPDFGKNRVSEYLLKFDKVGSFASEVIERGGRGSIYAAKYGAAGFAISQLIGLTGVYGFWTTLGVGAATLGGMATGAVVGAVKNQNVPWENEEGYIKREWPKVASGAGKILAGVATLGFMYLAAKQGADYLLPENGGPLNVGRAGLDFVYTLALGGLGYISAVTLWNKGEDQTIENSEEKEKKESVKLGYSPETHTYFGKVGDGPVTKFGVFLSPLSQGGTESCSDEEFIESVRETNREEGTRGGELKFGIPASQFNVLEHEEEYDGRVKEERDLKWVGEPGTERPLYEEIPNAPVIDRGYGAASIDTLISNPEKTTVTSEGELLGPGTEREYSLFVTELIRELFFRDASTKRTRDSFLEQLLERDGKIEEDVGRGSKVDVGTGRITQTVYDINKKGDTKNDEGHYINFDEAAEVYVETDVSGNREHASIKVEVTNGKTIDKEGELEEHSKYAVQIDIDSTYDPERVMGAVKTALEKVYEKTREEFGTVEVNAGNNYFSVKPEEAPELKRKDLVRGNILSKILRVASVPAMAICSLVGFGSIVSTDLGTFYHGARCSDIDDIIDESDECYSVGEASALLNSGNLEASRGELGEFVSEHPGRSYRPVTGVLEARAYVAEEAQLVMVGEIETADYSDELTKVRRAKKKALPGSRVRSQIKKYQRSLEFAQEHPDRVYVIQNGDIDGAIDPDTIANDIAGNLLASQDSRYIMNSQTELAQKINDANDNFKVVREGDYYTNGVGFVVALPVSDNPVE